VRLVNVADTSQRGRTETDVRNAKNERREGFKSSTPLSERMEQKQNGKEERREKAW
jgi:hypothetical protein